MRKRRLARPHAVAESGVLLRGDWIEALQSTCCALCRLARRKSQRYVAACLDEAVMDVTQRDVWRAARGFCPWHAAMAALTPHSAGSLALLYADILSHDADQLAALSQAAPSTWRSLKKRCQAWLQRWRTALPCPACHLWRTQEELYLQVLLDSWDEPSLQQAFATSVGLCWPHTYQLIVAGSNHPRLSAVLAAQLAHVQGLQEELQAFVRKLDYRFAREPYGAEADVWERVLRLYGGHVMQRPP